jgi:FdhD protein
MPTQSEYPSIKWEAGKTEPALGGCVPAEQPLTIYLNNKLLTTLMATPSQIEELIVGFLYSENILTSPKEIIKISINQDKRKIQAWIELNITPLLLEKTIMTSGCGRGFTFLCPSDLEGEEPLNGNLIIQPKEIINLTKKMLATANLYRQSGGIHSCIVADTQDIISFGEDIGRHNAVDKALGTCVLKGINLTDKILLTTGRVSSEMLLKAFKSKISIVGSLTSPTNLTVELGEKLGVSVVGYIRNNSMKIYTHPKRLINNEI